jgi:hypothetical protein
MLLRLLMFGSIALFGSTTAMTPDGKVVPPRNYKGSLEEKAQEAIIVFHSSNERGSAVEDLVSKISVPGSNLSQGADAMPLEVLSRKIVGKFAEDVRQWKDDLWAHPCYTDRNMVPHDVRPGGATAGTWASPPNLGDR